MEGSTLIEIATLISIVRLEDYAYGVAIREDIEGFLGQPVPLASVYAALQDLTRRQVLTVTQSRPLAVQGGRAKRLYRLSISGRSLLPGPAARLLQNLRSQIVILESQPTVTVADDNGVLRSPGSALPRRTVGTWTRAQFRT